MENRIEKTRNFINVSMPYSQGKSHTNLGTQGVRFHSQIEYFVLASNSRVIFAQFSSMYLFLQESMNANLMLAAVNILKTFST